ncbi:MAG: hypothetical protein R2827_00485 [Bdellovibrionales bacterium]
MTMYTKCCSNSNGGDDHYQPEDETCLEYAQANGYTKEGDIATNLGIYSMTMTPQKVSSHEMLFCPYFTKTDGTAIYVNAGLQIDSMEPDTWSDGTGLGAANLSLVAGENFGDAGTILGAYAKIQGVSNATGFPEFLQISTTTPSNDVIEEGDEILVTVGSRSGPSACGVDYHVDNVGNLYTNDIGPGYFGFYRVVEKSASNSYVVEKKGILKQMITPSLAGNMLATPTVATTHCAAYITKVVEAKDLTFGAGGRILSANQFNAGTGGGVIALRINGTLDMTDNLSSIEAAGAGYYSAASANQYGQGVKGLGGVTDTESGGQGGTFGGGGAGAGGSGGDSSSGQMGGDNFSGGDGFLMGSAGGQDGSASNNPISRQGSGGGIIYLAARKF